MLLKKTRKIVNTKMSDKQGKQAPFTGITVVHGHGASRIDHVQIGDRVWPVTPNNIMSTLFFGVRNVAIDPPTDVYYLSPEQYYQSNHPQPSPEDFKEELKMDEDGFEHVESAAQEEKRIQDYERAIEKWGEEKREFLEYHRLWYSNRQELLEYPASYIEDHRKKLKTKGYYSAKGWPLSRVDDSVRLWRFD